MYEQSRFEQTTNHSLDLTIAININNCYHRFQEIRSKEEKEKSRTQMS